MEQACFKEMNRLVRTRMLGGVGGARRKPAPIPIVLLFRVFLFAYRLSLKDAVRFIKLENSTGCFANWRPW